MLHAELLLCTCPKPLTQQPHIDVHLLMQELLQAAISLQPRAMWLGFGDWQPTAGTIKEANIKLFCMVPSLEAAAQAIEAGADVIVVQVCNRTMLYLQQSMNALT